MGHFVAARSPEMWPEVNPERLSPQLILHYSSKLKLFDHRNSMPGAGLYLVTEGQVRYVNRGFGTITAKAGDLVCLRPGFVETQSKNGYRVYAAAYRATFDDPRGVPSLPQFGLLSPIVTIGSKQRIEEVSQLYERMIESMLAHRVTWRLEIMTALSELIRLAFSLAVGNKSAEKAGWTRWERLLSLIETDSDAISNVQMARAMNMSVRSFGRGFRERFGITPKQYLFAPPAVARTRSASDWLEHQSRGV